MTKEELRDTRPSTIIRVMGDGRSFVSPHAPMCTRCGAFPEPFWMIHADTIGADGSSRRSSSFGPEPSEEAAREHLAQLKKECPEFTHWEISRCVPGLIMTLVETCDTDKEAGS
jgi:hypothetical protein